MSVCNPETGKLIDAADLDSDGMLSQSELEAMTKAQIAELAAEFGYSGITTTMTKAEMIAAFLAAQEE